jgi:hypothetical protein
LESAILKSRPGDTIRLLPGNYSNIKSIEISNTDLSFEGESPNSASEHPAIITLARELKRLPLFSIIDSNITMTNIHFYNIQRPCIVIRRSSPTSMASLTLNNSTFRRIHAELRSFAPELLPIHGAAVSADASLFINNCSFAEVTVHLGALSLDVKKMVGGAIGIGFRCNVTTDIVIENTIFKG